MELKLSQRKWIGFAAIVIIGTIMAWTLVKTRVLDLIEARTWDWRLRAAAPYTPPDSRIKLIMIDQSSLDYFAKEQNLFWQWPRSMYVPVLKFLQKAGARAAAFDILFIEQSYWGVKEDEELAAAMRETIPAVNAVQVGSQRGAAEIPAVIEKAAARAAKARIAKDYEAWRGRADSYSLRLPVPEIASASAGLGNVGAFPDADGVYRHHIPLVWVGEKPLLSLPFALAEAADPAGFAGIGISEFLDLQGQLGVRFSGGEGTFATFSIASIIRSMIQVDEGAAPEVPLETFKDSYVLVGMSALGLLDLKPSPVAEVYPGTEMNATVLDNLLNQRFMRKLPERWNVVMAALLLSALAAASLFTRTLYQQIGIPLGLIAVFVGAAFACAICGWWIWLSAPLAAMAFGTLAGLGLQYQLEGRAHRFIRSAFGHYVSPEVIEQIVANPGQLALGGERREVSLLFSDVKGFSTISEKMSPSNLVALLNEYFDAMTALILEKQGTLDKYQGDAIMALWNAPLLVKDHAARAVSAALACQARLAELRPYFNDKFGIEVYSRIGIHTGPVTVGNFGSKARFDYTAIGDAANLASRLEGACKQFGISLLISGETRQQLDESIFCRKVGALRVQGRSSVVAVFEPVAGVKAVLEETYAEFTRGLSAFEAGELPEAARIFSALPNDPVAAAYTRRIEQEQDGTREGWSPVWNLKQK